MNGGSICIKDFRGYNSLAVMPRQHKKLLLYMFVLSLSYQFKTETSKKLHLATTSAVVSKKNNGGQVSCVGQDSSYKG